MSVEDRVDRRRQRGDDASEIGRYAACLIEQHQITPWYALPIDEDRLRAILNDEEWAAYRRVTASNWAKAKRKQLADAAARATAQAETKLAAHAARVREQQIRQLREEDAAIRRSLLAKGAVTIREVARRLDLSVYRVRKLHSEGLLPSAGFVPIQRSRGKPVHLWLPATLVRFLTARVVSRSRSE